MSPEPVSPELVLIDPELAECERARLREKAVLEAYLVAHPAPSPVQPVVAEPEPVMRTPRLTTHAFLRRRVLPAALVASLFANGYLVSDLVLRLDRQDSTVVPVAVRPAVTVTRQDEVAGTAAISASHATVPRRQTHVKLARKTVVERRLASLMLSAPTHRLPRAFVDPTTGLVRNNIQVVCRAVKRSSYLCTIRLAKQRNPRALVVRYGSTRAGRGAFTWYGYKRIP